MLKRTLRTSPSETTYVLPSSRCRPCAAAFACEPSRTRSSQRITSARMKPRAMSEWIVSAASRAVWPRRSVHARASVSPAVMNVIRSSASVRRRATSARAEGRPSRNAAASSSGSSASSSSSFASSSSRAVDDREQRLRRQRLELGRQLARVRERRAGLHVGEQLLEPRRPRPASPARPTSPPSRRARAGARRGRGRRPAARAGASRGRAPDRRWRRSRPGRRGSRRPGAGCRAAGRPFPGTSTTRIAAGVTLAEPTTLGDLRRAGRLRRWPCRRAPCRSPRPRRRPSGR